jgi:hypothetical protein
MSAPTPVQQLATLQEQVANLQAQVAALQNAARSFTSRPKPILPDPIKFDGKAYHFDTWLPSIKAKLRVDGTSGALGDSIAQFYYVYDRLESNVQSQVLPQLATAEEAQYWSYQTILDQLARALDNPNKTQEAVDRLHRIEQSSGESIPNYIAKFERLLYEAKGHNWDDDRKISAFRFGLNATIKNRLAQQLELPSTYPKFLQAVQKLSSRSGTILAPAAPSGPSNTLQQYRQSNPPVATRYSDPMDVSQMDIGLNTFDFCEMNSDGTHTGVRHPDPVRLIQEASERTGISINNIGFDPSLKGKTPIQVHRSQSSSPRQSYRDTGACLRCGSFDHWLSTCPEPARPSTNSRSAGTTGKRVTIAALDDDDDNNDEPYSQWYV